MIVIADTSPLHYLILLERAEVLQHLYGRVIIPEAVVRELQAQKTPAVVRQWITSPPEWLQIRQIAVPPDPALAELDLAGVYCGFVRQIPKSSFLCSLRRPVGITHGG